MNPTENALVQFLSQRFPWWGNCHFRWLPQKKFLYIYSQNVSKRRRILGELQTLAGSDLTIQKLILIQPPYPATIVSCTAEAQQPSYKR